MANKLKSNKALVEQALAELFDVEGDVEWNNAAHAVGTFYVKGFKFTYSVDSTNKGDYTLAKTKSMVVKSLQAKAVQWGYLGDASEFKTKFLKG